MTNDGEQLEMVLHYGVSKEQACIMCHLSSECSGCCLKCEKRITGTCSSQTCSLPSREHEGERWETWMHLVQTCLPELRKFVPAKYLKGHPKMRE